MKTRIVIGILGLTLAGSIVMAQENDDMYFNSKDRQKQKAESVATTSVNQKIDDDYNTFRKKHFDQDEKEVAETSNPTDSYSARTINPEYISRSNSEQASEDEQNYYEEGYAATTYDAYSSNNNGYNNYNGGSSWNGNYGYYNNPYSYSYNNPYSYYSPYNSIYPSNSFYSPYYGYGYNPWMSPHGGSGWGISMSYSFGSPYYYSPFGYSGYYSPYSSGWGYPGSYYYSGSEASRVHYGKRPSRHSAIVLPTRQRPEREVTANTNGRTSNSRTRPASDEYYVKPFKRTSTFDRTINSTTGTYSRDQYTTKPSSDRSRFSESSSQPRPSYSAPSRNRSLSSGSAPARSSGSSGSRSRGRD